MHASLSLYIICEAEKKIILLLFPEISLNNIKINKFSYAFEYTQHRKSDIKVYLVTIGIKITKTRFLITIVKKSKIFLFVFNF